MHALEASKAAPCRPEAAALPPIELLAREWAAIVASSGALGAATTQVLAHRAAMLGSADATPVALQLAELWRMSLEKPLAAWRACALLGSWPWSATELMLRAAARQVSPDTLTMELAAAGAATVRATFDTMHEQVAANVARLEQRCGPSAAAVPEPAAAPGS